MYGHNIIVIQYALYTEVQGKQGLWIGIRLGLVTTNWHACNRLMLCIPMTVIKLIIVLSFLVPVAMQHMATDRSVVTHAYM